MSKKVIFKVSHKIVCDIQKRNPKAADVCLGAGAGAVIIIYGSAEQELKEIFAAPQHCFNNIFSARPVSGEAGEEGEPEHEAAAAPRQTGAH
jgi:hypothetical protein